MKTKQTSTITLRGKPLVKIDKAKAYLARCGVRNVCDLDVVHIALDLLRFEPGLVDAIGHIKPTESGGKSPKKPATKKRNLAPNPMIAVLEKLRKTSETPADKRQPETGGQHV